MGGLWEHQKAAVRTFTDYLDGDGTATAALVSMPTGTGKSAVVANLVASKRLVSAGRSVMVLAPWRGLERQLRADIDQRVWSSIGLERPADLPRVVGVKNATEFVRAHQKAQGEALIHVATMAMALEIFRRVDKDVRKMRALFSSFSAVIVDECHYEPAPSWSEAVRAMGVPTCLLTATPFRNDNRFFMLNAGAQYRYSHNQAIADHILRKPEFLVLKPSLPGAHNYVRSLLSRLNDLKLLQENRVIVRCGSAESVVDITKALRDRGESAVGFHESFTAKRESESLLRAVPSPDKRPNVRFWVHQHKLTEGFDDPSAVVLAVYEELGSDRAKIQQIGRVLRNPSRRQDARAWVISPDADMQETWTRYLAFDVGYHPKSMAKDPTGVEALLEAQPETFYWERKFRQRPELEAPTVCEDLIFRFSSVIRTCPDKPDLDTLASDVRADLVTKQRHVLNVATPETNSRVLLYLTIQNSPILRSGAFVEVRLGYTVLHWNSGRLFVADTTSLIPLSVLAATGYLDAKSMATLLPEGSRISEVSLTNNDLSQWSIRSRSLGAHDLGQIASESGDSTYAYATVQGHLEIAGGSVRRYTGTRNGRVADKRQTQGKFTELLAWFQEITNSLNAAKHPAAAIERYSAPVRPPANPKAAHVLVDIDPHDFKPVMKGAGPLAIQSSGSEVDNSGNFKIEISDQVFDARIDWAGHARRFEIGSRPDVPYQTISDSREFWDEVTRHQAIRVATADGLVYSNGNFWHLANRNRGASTGLLSILTVHEPLATVVGEKGPLNSNKRFPDDTVFGQIEDVLLPRVLGATGNILCVDMGTEIADFIGFTDERVIAVHAKAKRKRGTSTTASSISASALHEVVSQALKSMKYLTVGNQDQPPNATWHLKWNGGTALGKADRLRAGKPSYSGPAYWNRINKVVQSHAADKEVWLVLGKSLSKSALTKELSRPAPKAVALQVHSLLVSAWTATQQCGVKLRIYCSP